MAAPAYARIASDLRTKIKSRDIKPGGHLPSELELREEYQASRNTVLDAIKMLRDEGLVETKPGQGWFAKVKIVPFVNSIGWEDGTAITEAKARGRNPQFTPPIVSRRGAPPEVADRLQIPPTTQMVVRQQEWHLDDMPWKLQTVWCQVARCREGAHRLLVAEDIPEGVGNYLYSALDLHPAGVAFHFLPREPTADEARFFGFPDEGSVPYVIQLTRIANVADGGRTCPLYAAVGIYAADRNRFESFRPAPTGELPPAGPVDADQRPGGPGAVAGSVELERPSPVLPADSERDS
jgi:GntR family transcriptional regulator